MMRAIILAMAALSNAAPVLAAPVYVMRHLERDPGRDPGLNTIGAANAERLADWFRRDRPRAIYVTQFRRAQETAAPLARRLGLTPIVYDANAPDAVLAKVKAAKGPVLIVGHSNTVPKLVAALGGPKAADLADNDYGRIWIVRPGGRVRVARLAEPQPR